MIVSFSEISRQGTCYALTDISDLADANEWVVGEPMRANCRLVKKNEGRVVLHGRLQIPVRIRCDRCLELFEFSIDTEFDLILKIESSFEESSETICSRNDLDTVFLTEPVVDLADIFRQHLYLALPTKRLCFDQCAGLCSGCGQNLNIKSCRCRKIQPDSPFACLAALKRHEQ